MKKNINIGGMSCAACSSSIERVLSKMDGVNSVSVNLTTNSAIIDYDESVLSFDDIVKKIHKLGFTVPTEITSLNTSVSDNNMTTLELRIEGMSCTACSSSIERVLSKMEGVSSISVNLTTHMATIVYDVNKVRISELFAKIQKLGFKAFDTKVDTDISKSVYNTEKELREKWKQFRLSAIFTVILMYVSMGHMINLPLPNFFDRSTNPLNYAFLQLVLTVPVMYIGRNFYVNGYRSLVRRVPNMDSLIAVSTTAAFLYSLYSTRMLVVEADKLLHVNQLYFETVAMIITLIFMGKTLEFRSKSHTSDAIKKLMNLRPKTAEVLVNGKMVTMPVDSIQLGDIVLVKAGETIAVDGKIVNGSTSVDESLISGESMPVEKSMHDEVVGGSINISGVIEIEMTKTQQDTVINKIIKMVEDAQSKKAPIAKIADKVAGYFVPVVMTIALISAIIWYISGGDINFSIKIFVSVLVIACPCALGLATPTAIMVGTGRATKEGVLIKSGEALESIHKIDVVLLDKTGTITEGKPVVTFSKVFNGFSESDVLNHLYTIEDNSSHPLANALSTFCEHRGAVKLDSISITEIAGSGIVSEFAIGTIYLGNQQFMKDSNINLSALHVDDEINNLLSTIIYMSMFGKIAAIFAVEDVIKDSSIEAVKCFRKLGVKTVMLTGDNEKSANKIAKLSTVDEYKSGLLPSEKSDVVREYKDKGYFTAMIGDGINDAPSLALADVGFAIGRGTDVAVESADVVLMKDNLMDAIFAIQISRATIKNIKQNLFFAFIYNILGIPFAAGVVYAFGGILLNPMIGALAMSLSSVSVVSNALRLRNFEMK